MTVINRDVVTLIDQRIAAAQRTERAVGTVVTVDSSLLRATVTFDGSALAVPVRVAGGVSVVAGDRVTLDRYGSDWVVTACFAVRWPACEGLNGASGSGTTTSGVWVRMPGDPEFAFVKRWADTRVEATVATSAYVAGSAATRMTAGVRFVPAAGGASTDAHVVQYYFNATLDHRAFSGTQLVSGLAAGVYTVQLVWARVGGSGTLTQDTGDWLSAVCREVAA